MATTPDTSYHAQITRIIKVALIEQDSRTYHGTLGSVDELAQKTAGEILGVLAEAEKERKLQELLNPRRGIQIGHGNQQVNHFG